MPKFAIIFVIVSEKLRELIECELNPVTSRFTLRFARSIIEAEALLDGLKVEELKAAVILCEQELDDGRGVDFLIRSDAKHRDCRKILLGQSPDLDGMIEAVNQSRLDYYLQYPWEEGALGRIVIEQATQFVLEQPDLDLLPFAHVLDQQLLLKTHVERQIARYRQGFLDYTHFSDEELSSRLIDALYKFFAGNDETHACRCYSPGHQLTREGEQNNFLWLISKGEVVLKKCDSQGATQEVVRYDKGALVGGMSFVTGEPAFTSSETVTEVEVIKLDKALFAKVMSARTELLPLFTNMLLRHFDRRLQQSIRTKMKLQETLQSLDAAYRQLIETEKMAVLGELVAGVAHELNNPVAAIIRGTEKLQRQIPELTRLELSSDLSSLGDRILRQAMASYPLSTRDVRERVGRVNDKLTSRALAKKVVQMRLDEDTAWVDIAAEGSGRQFYLIEQLDRFYQVGSFLRNIDVCARRIADLVKSLKQYAKQADGQLSWVDLHEGLEDTLVIFDNKLKHFHLEKEYTPLPAIHCDALALQQVWTNFISNAIEAIEAREQPSGMIVIRTQNLPQTRPPSVRVTVEDNGIGIAREIQDKIFDLNFTTKREGDFGLGIGLSVCSQIVQSHGGHIAVESAPGQYTRMSVTLPLDAPHAHTNKETDNHE